MVPFVSFFPLTFFLKIQILPRFYLYDAIVHIIRKHLDNMCNFKCAWEIIRMYDTDAPIIDDDGNLMQTSYCWLTRCVCVASTLEALVSQPKDANVPGDHDSKRRQHNFPQNLSDLMMAPTILSRVILETILARRHFALTSVLSCLYLPLPEQTQNHHDC